MSLPNTAPLQQRFEARLPDPLPAADQCWEWQGTATVKGYCQIQTAGKQQLVHRVAYELHNGPIPPGECVYHDCDNRKCVNHNHLFLGTPAD